MPQGLAVQRLISVTVTLNPVAAQGINFDTCLIVGDSNVINTQDRIRSYNSLADIAADFGTNAPEYAAAVLFFSQVPQPGQLYIGRWASSATHGLLVGGPLTTAQALPTAWNILANAEFHINADGAGLVNIGPVDLTGTSNLNGVATALQAAIQTHGGALAAVTVQWNAPQNQFTFASGTTGTMSTIAALTAGSAGTDISVQLKGTAATLSEILAGIGAESAVTAVTILDGLQTQWYGLLFASANVVDADCLAVAAYVQGSTNPHLFGWTTSEAAALTTNDTSSIGYQLKQLGYTRTFYQYSSSSAYAAASIFGRGCTVNFTGSLTVINFMWQQEPGVIAEALTSSEADALDARNYNYFAQFNNNTSIVVNGKVANGDYIDEIWDLDYLANTVMTSIYNLLYTAGTKIPQTDAGNHQLFNAIEAAMAVGLTNGTLGPGQWNLPGFGQLNTGDFLPKGYYIYVPPISSQLQADREARKSVPIQIAGKLSGAIDTVNAQIIVNR